LTVDSWGEVGFLAVKVVVSNIRVIFSYFENVCKGWNGFFLGGKAQIKPLKHGYFSVIIEK